MTPNHTQETVSVANINQDVFDYNNHNNSNDSDSDDFVHSLAHVLDNRTDNNLDSATKDPINNKEHGRKTNNEQAPITIEKDFSHPLVEEAFQSLMMAVGYLNEQETADLIDACYFGDKAHIKDKRKSGEPYITHPIAVAEITAGFNLDRDTVIAAVLHDTVEDTEVTLEELVTRYGQKVAQLVDGVTKLKSSKHNKQQNKAATFHKILLSTLDDPRVLIIKLSDRLHNMSTLGAVKKEKQQSTAKETLDFYIPFARVMGMNDIADHIEMLCYRNLDLNMYTKLSDKLLQHGLGRKLRKDNIQGYLQHILQKKSFSGHVKVIDNQVVMYRQFFRNRGKIDRLIRYYDFEIILEDIQSCKSLAHYLTETYEIPDYQISDNIRNPLPGGNQSLTLIYKNQYDNITITLLTRNMQRIASLGVISSDNTSKVSQSVIEASLRNMKGVVMYGYGNPEESQNNSKIKEDSAENQLNFDEAQSTIEDLLSYLHERKILCYSPQGKAYELPRGSTALDFAYAVGPFIGHIAVSAIVDGEAADLASVVTNGQQIKILTDNQSTPKAEWLGFVGTAKARDLISKWLNNLSTKDKLAQGKQALGRALQTYDKKIEDLSGSEWRDLMAWRGISHIDQLYAQIASSQLLPQLIVSRLFSEEINSKLDILTQKNQPQNLLATLPGVEISFPKCCNPIYGDPIIGYNSKNHGLVVHRHKCYQLEDMREQFPKRIFHIKWRNHSEKKQRQSGEHAHFPAYLNLNMLVSDEQLSTAVSRLKEINIGIEKVDNLKNTTILRVIVRGRDHVKEGIDQLRHLLGFTNIERMYQINYKQK